MEVSTEINEGSNARHKTRLTPGPESGLADQAGERAIKWVVIVATLCGQCGCGCPPRFHPRAEDAVAGG